MTTFIALLDSPLIERCGWALVHFIWQGSAVAVVVAALLAVTRSAAASIRYCGLCIAFGVMATLPLVTATVVDVSPQSNARVAPVEPMTQRPSEEVEAALVSSNMLQPAETMASVRVEQPSHSSTAMDRPSAASAAARAYAASTLKQRVKHSIAGALPWFVAIWLAGVAALCLRLLSTWRRVRDLRRIGTRPMGDPWDTRLRVIARRLNLTRPIELLQSAVIEVPTMVGCVRPVILLPVSVLTSLSPLEIDAILAHESAHIRRHDFLVNLIQSALEILLFYHPAVWWISAQIRQERECCCDDLASALCETRAQYVSALVRMEELRAVQDQLALAASGGRLVDRIRRLVRPHGPDRRIPWWLGGVLAASLALIAAIALGLQNHAVADPSNTKHAAKVLTPKAIADGIEAAMKRFASVEYRASFERVRDAKGFHADGRPPILVSGKGNYLFRSDGTRWFADEDSFTVTIGEPHARPTKIVAGFDGERHFSSDSRRWSLGEYDLSDRRLAPQVIFWRGGRTYEWLLAALRKDEARLVRQETIGGADCLVVVSEFGKEKALPNGKTAREWKYDIAISPDQSFLPLRVVVEHDGAPYSDETIAELAQTNDGVWFPTRIDRKSAPTQWGWEDVSESLVVEELKLRTDFGVEDFRIAIPMGADVIDYRLGYAWHNDPWWSELEPWLRQEREWPEHDLRWVGEIGSNAARELDGKLAPDITAAEWINDDASKWSRPGRHVTVLFFFGGQAIHPTPQWIAALKALHELYKDRGLDMVGVATATDSPQVVRQTVKELGVSFPVAIDSKSEKGFGHTFDRYGLENYAGIMVVDSEGIVRHVVQGGAPDASVSHLEHLVRTHCKPGAEKPISPVRAARKQEEGGSFDRLGMSDFRAIEAEWKSRARTKHGAAIVRGHVKLAKNKSAQVRIEPFFRMLFSNTMGGYFVMRDRERAIQTVADEQGNFSFVGLRKGAYTLTVSSPGLAKQEKEVILTDDDSEAEIALEMKQGDKVIGIVVDNAGRPIAGATVKPTLRYLDPESPIAMVYSTTAHLPSDPIRTDAKGRFEFADLYFGGYKLQISAPEHEPAVVDRVPAGKQDVKVTLKSLAK